MTDNQKSNKYGANHVYLLIQQKVVLNEWCICGITWWLLQGNRYSTWFSIGLEEKKGIWSELNPILELLQKS